MMKQQRSNSMLFGSNAPFVEELYEDYLSDPQSVPDEWRTYFDGLKVGAEAAVRDVAHGPIVAAF